MYRYFRDGTQATLLGERQGTLPNRIAHICAAQKLEEAVATKNKSAMWLVSNCHTSSKRENYIKELSKHIPVDIFGGCGKRGCAKGRQEASCLTNEGKKYWFVQNTSVLSISNAFQSSGSSSPLRTAFVEITLLRSSAACATSCYHWY